MPRHPSLGTPRVRRAVRDAGRQGGVLSRKQLYALGVTRWEIRGHVRAKRWQLIGDQSVHLANGDLSRTGELWAAVFQGGPRACLDGGSALIAGGLERYERSPIRVSVPRGAKVRRTKRFDIRQTRRWSADDIVTAGVPRTRAPVAAVRAALWARTAREATYVVTLVVQQGKATPEALAEQLLRIKRDPRRQLLHEVVNELLDGARSLGEVDVARELERRGFPRPTRQVLRTDAARRYYLDLYWEDFEVVLEIDGIHHAWAENVVGDALRQNALVLDGDVVLRLPLLGLRTQPEEFFAQVAQALRAGGWVSEAA